MANQNTKNKTGARPTHDMGEISDGGALNNLNRAEPRVGLKLGLDTNLYHKYRGNATKAKFNGERGYK